MAICLFFISRRRPGCVDSNTSITSISCVMVSLPSVASYGIFWRQWIWGESKISFLLSHPYLYASLYRDTKGYQGADLSKCQTKSEKSCLSIGTCWPHTYMKPQREIMTYDQQNGTCILYFHLQSGILRLVSSLKPSNRYPKKFPSSKNAITASQP